MIYDSKHILFGYWLYRFDCDARQSNISGGNVLNQTVVVDDIIFTFWNLSMAMEVNFLLLEHHTNNENTINVRHLIGF